MAQAVLCILSLEIFKIGNTMKTFLFLALSFYLADGFAFGLSQAPPGYNGPSLNMGPYKMIPNANSSSSRSSDDVHTVVFTNWKMTMRVVSEGKLPVLGLSILSCRDPNKLLIHCTPMKYGDIQITQGDVSIEFATSKSFLERSIVLTFNEHWWRRSTKHILNAKDFDGPPVIVNLNGQAVEIKIEKNGQFERQYYN